MVRNGNCVAEAGRNSDARAVSDCAFVKIAGTVTGTGTAAELTLVGKTSVRFDA
jgi:hypothetical protein